MIDVLFFGEHMHLELIARGDWSFVRALAVQVHRADAVGGARSAKRRPMSWPFSSGSALPYPIEVPIDSEPGRGGQSVWLSDDNRPSCHLKSPTIDVKALVGV